jgi:hypothetical protein
MIAGPRGQGNSSIDAEGFDGLRLGARPSTLMKRRAVVHPLLGLLRKELARVAEPARAPAMQAYMKSVLPFGAWWRRNCGRCVASCLRRTPSSARRVGARTASGGRRRGLLECGSPMAASTRRKCTGTKPMASVAKKRKLSGSSARNRLAFVVRLSSRGYAASLEARKIYRTRADASAREVGLLRVVDESGESYLYPAARFEYLALPPRIARALTR